MKEESIKKARAALREAAKALEDLPHPRLLKRIAILESENDKQAQQIEELTVTVERQRKENEAWTMLKRKYEARGHRITSSGKVKLRPEGQSA